MTSSHGFRVRYQEFGDSATVAQLQCFIDHPALRGRARHCLIERIDREFREEDIKIPFPQRELTFFEGGNSISLEDDETETNGRREQSVDEFVETGRRS